MQTSGSGKWRDCTSIMNHEQAASSSICVPIIWSLYKILTTRKLPWKNGLFEDNFPLQGGDFDVPSTSSLQFRLVGCPLLLWGQRRWPIAHSILRPATRYPKIPSTVIAINDEDNLTV